MIRRNSIIYAAVVLIALGGFCFYFFRKRDDSSVVPPTVASVAERPVVSAPTVSPGPSRIAMKAPDREELANVPPNPMAGAIGSDKVTPEKEIAILLELFQIYRREFGGFPAGQDNDQFMNALRGANPGKLPIFPPDHPRLDPKGNLLDPWRQPYRFHPVSRDRLEIRSAGPDREIFTADDLVVPK